MELTFTRKFKNPRVPNYILRDGAGPKISIADLTDEQLISIADQWKDDLLARAKAIRQQPVAAEE